MHRKKVSQNTSGETTECIQAEKSSKTVLIMAFIRFFLPYYTGIRIEIQYHGVGASWPQGVALFAQKMFHNDFIAVLTHADAYRDTGSRGYLFYPGDYLQILAPSFPAAKAGLGVYNKARSMLCIRDLF